MFQFHFVLSLIFPFLLSSSMPFEEESEAEHELGPCIGKRELIWPLDFDANEDLKCAI